MATVVVLNGTSSSGKTAIARQLQEAMLPAVFLNFSIDSILHALPSSALARIATGADIRDLRYPELARAFYGCVRELLRLGHSLVIDNAITARYQAELLAATIESHDALVVGLECDAETLSVRERARGDRRTGLALQQLAAIHRWLEYDLMVDTARATPAAAAAVIAEAVRAGRRGASERLRQKLAGG